MEGSRSRWTDDRLDDLVREIRRDFDELTRRLDRRDAERKEERKLAEQYRREDHKFNRNLGLGVTAILLTAVGILVNVL